MKLLTNHREWQIAIVFLSRVTLPDMPRGTEKTIVITGGTAGMGYEAVKHFLALGYNVILGKDSANPFVNDRKLVKSYLHEERIRVQAP